MQLTSIHPGVVITSEGALLNHQAANGHLSGNQTLYGTDGNVPPCCVNFLNMRKESFSWRFFDKLVYSGIFSKSCQMFDGKFWSTYYHNLICHIRNTVILCYFSSLSLVEEDF